MEKIIPLSALCTGKAAPVYLFLLELIQKTGKMQFLIQRCSIAQALALRDLDTISKALQRLEDCGLIQYRLEVTRDPCGKLVSSCYRILVFRTSLTEALKTSSVAEPPSLEDADAGSTGSGQPAPGANGAATPPADQAIEVIRARGRKLMAHVLKHLDDLHREDLRKLVERAVAREINLEQTTLRIFFSDQRDVDLAQQDPNCASYIATFLRYDDLEYGFWTVKFELQDATPALESSCGCGRDGAARF